MSDIKIAVTTPYLNSHGGHARVILKIAEHFDADIRCLIYEPETTYDEFRELNVRAEGPGPLRRIPIGNSMARMVDTGSRFYNWKLEGYDLINPHVSPSEWIRNRNSPVLWYCYSPYRLAYDLYDWKMKNSGNLERMKLAGSGAAYRFLDARTIPEIEHIFSVSKNADERIRKYLNRESEVLYPGVDAEKFSCRGYENFFFYPSRICAEKNFEFAIEAFRKFSVKNKGWKLMIAGSVSDPIYLKKLQSLCGDSVMIETNVSDERLHGLYSTCYAVIFSPLDEDFGLVPLEAFASSKPVIAMNRGGPRETIIDSVDGFLVDDIDGMAAKMEFLAENPDKCEEMGRNGRHKVLERFTWGHFLSRFEEKAKELISEGS